MQVSAVEAGEDKETVSPEARRKNTALSAPLVKPSKVCVRFLATRTVK